MHFQLSSITSTCESQWNMWLIKVLGVIYFAAVCTAQETTYSPLLEYETEAPTAIPTVYVPPVPTLQLQTAWSDVFPSEKVEFSCNVSNIADWTISWSRGGVDLSFEGPVLTTTAEKNSASYSCKGLHKVKGVHTAPSNSLTLRVYENKPKATISRSSNFDPMFRGESITFTCKVVESTGWEYIWYHNGTEIPAANANVYTITSIDHSHNGQYYCNAKRGKGPFIAQESEKRTLQVIDPPKPDMKLQTPWMDVFEDEIVEFTCGLNSNDWTINWYKDQKLLIEDTVLIIDQEEALLNITSMTQRYQGVYACEGVHRSRGVRSELSNTVKVTVYDHIPTATLSRAPDLNTMYVGETVNFTCDVDVSSGWEYHWYKDEKFHQTSKTMSVYLDISSEGNYSCEATRKKTSTVSSEKIQQKVLAIPVTSLKALTPWLDVFPDESVKLSCRMSDGSGWTYKWHKDGQEVQASSVVSFELNGAILSISSASAAHKGQYKCKGHLKDRSVSSDFSSGLDLKVYDKKPSVKLTQDPDYELMFPDESVSFNCHINDSSGWQYLWYKDGESFGQSKNIYSISSVKTTSGGSYKCQAKRGTGRVFITDSSNAVLLTVEENKPKPSMTQQPDTDKLYTGESVSFECQVRLSSGWQYLWYKDEVPISSSSSSSSSSLNIANAGGSDSGTYKCMAIRDKTMYPTEYSAPRTLRVVEIPVPAVKLMTQWLDVFPTERVKLSCGMDGSNDWTYTWYKYGEEVRASDTVSFGQDQSSLIISSASASHRGQYNCSAKLKARSVSSTFSPGLTLKVYDEKPRVTLTQNPSHDLMHTEDSVSFGCHINVSSGWEYLWFKDDTRLTESGINHNITSVLTKDTASYHCQIKRGGGDAVFHSDKSPAVKLNIEERPKAEIVLLTGWSKVFSTDSLELKCGVLDSQDSWNYTWFKEGQPIYLSPSEIHIVTPQNNPEQSLYSCQGIRNGRPSYSKISDDFKTKNLLLKRRVLLSISGCIFFGIIFVFLGCIILRVIRQPASDEYKPEDVDLFPRMIHPNGLDDTPCPLVEYITDAALNAPPKEGDENGTICSETTPLPITSQEEQAVTTEGQDASENNGGLVSFKQ